MGQAASKATEAVKRVAPRISQTIQTQRTRAAAEAEWKRSSAASTQQTGAGDYSPTRGQQHTTSADVDAASSMPEMPPDLIKFLNDAGPLQRTVDKERTSAKVYDTLVSDENARDEQARQANMRVRRKMPIMSSYTSSDGNDVVDGTMTERTTNFSTKDRDHQSTKRLGVTREDLFQLSNVLRGCGGEVGSSQWRGVVESEYEGIVARKNSSELTKKNKTSTTKNFDQLQDKALFENCLKYIGTPVLMIDSDGDIIGTWPQKAEEVKHSSGLKLVPENSYEFIMKSEK